MGDEFLLSEMERGNEKAFQKLFEMYWQPMHRKAIGIVQKDAIAKDIVQAIWIDLWQKRGDRKIQNLSAYLFQTVINNCYKYFRDNRFSESQLRIIDTLHIPSVSEMEKQHDLEETQLTIEKSLNRLSPRSRQIFKLSKMEDASNEEIASRLGISKKSVENQLSLALRIIKKDLIFPIFLLTSIIF
ncbi:sigma-70 family RNA polymerase sigma factor [Maribacter sp. 2304DJ31-5]|uniref:sigma-70 family RNA polymerase sigma factor n=1 Tax=Maribacter sp. 2304DJ31-5 TaxID=3386273 RepID=UPI0039BCF91F